jgi:hypothetical protein
MGVQFEASDSITMTVSSAPGGEILVEAIAPSRVSDNLFFWDFADLDIPILLQEGMEVMVTNGDMMAKHVILPITIDSVDLKADKIRGTGAPGARLDVYVFEEGDDVENPKRIRLPGKWVSPEGKEGFNPAYIVDSSGCWEVDLGAEGINISSDSELHVDSSAGPFDIDWHDPATRASFDPLNGRYVNKKGHTSAYWPIHDGIDIDTILDYNAVGIHGLLADIDAELTVRSSAGGPVLFNDSQTSDAEGSVVWGVPL